MASNNPGGAWPVDKNTGKSIQNAATHVFHLMQFWKALREGHLKADMSKNGTHFSMHQFRNLFNTARIPKSNEDELRSFWRTESEGQSPTHAVVLRNGHAFVFHPVDDKSKQPKSTAQIRQILEKIKEAADQMNQGPGVGALTYDFRDRWVKNRQQLVVKGDYLGLCSNSNLPILKSVNFSRKQ